MQLKGSLVSALCLISYRALLSKLRDRHAKRKGMGVHVIGETALKMNRRTTLLLFPYIPF